ncbi:hypothetical protein [Cellulomonas sp. Y8]|uniref:hypothetical protein n=1 Tax=Cellulomonas sp. Y8 TaxID=2591145 RepID=UPI003D715A21
MPSLKFNDAEVNAVGTRFTSAGRSMPEAWHASCDLGSEALNALLGSVRSSVTDGLMGAAAEVFSLGQVALDARETYRKTDASL